MTPSRQPGAIGGGITDVDRGLREDPKVGKSIVVEGEVGDINISDHDES